MVLVVALYILGVLCCASLELPSIADALMHTPVCNGPEAI